MNDGQPYEGKPYEGQPYEGQSYEDKLYEDQLYEVQRARSGHMARTGCIRSKQDQAYKTRGGQYKTE